MPRTRAGRRYPHATTDARRHECAMCPVIGAIAGAAADGREEWGTAHRLPPMVEGTDQHAESVRDELFNGRNCPRLRRLHGPLSVSVKFLTPDGQEVNQPATRRPEGWVYIVRVWPRDQARAEITRRVGRGEELDYNIMRS